MKKTLTFTILLILLLVGCNTNNASKQNGTVEQVKIIPPNEVEIDALYEKQFSLEEIINRSSNIVLGHVIENIYFDDTINIYRFNVINNIKGTTDETVIDLYGAPNKYELGKDYIVFLNYMDSVFYEKKAYSPFIEFKACIDNDIITEFLLFNTDIAPDYPNIDTLIKYIKEVDKGINTNIAIVRNEYIDSEDISEIFNFSDVVCDIETYGIIASNPNVVYYKAKVIKSYKGNIKSDIIVHLPASTEINNEYLVFINEINEGSYSINSMISFVSKDSENEYTRYIDEINRLNAD